jgi:hypothetical protein
VVSMLVIHYATSMKKEHLPQMIGAICAWLSGVPARIGLGGLLAVGSLHADAPSVTGQSNAQFEAMFKSEVRPLLAEYCLDCHSVEKQKGELNLERFDSLDALRKDVKPWQAMIEQLETGEMPPKKKAHPPL